MQVKGQPGPVLPGVFRPQEWAWVSHALAQHTFAAGPARSHLGAPGGSTPDALPRAVPSHPTPAHPLPRPRLTDFGPHVTEGTCPFPVEQRPQRACQRCVQSRHVGRSSRLSPRQPTAGGTKVPVAPGTIGASAGAGLRQRLKLQTRGQVSNEGFGTKKAPFCLADSFFLSRFCVYHPEPPGR